MPWHRPILAGVGVLVMAAALWRRFSVADPALRGVDQRGPLSELLA